MLPPCSVSQAKRTLMSVSGSVMRNAQEAEARTLKMSSCCRSTVHWAPLVGPSNPARLSCRPFSSATITATFVAAIGGLFTEERTGSRVSHHLWLYVLVGNVSGAYIADGSLVINIVVKTRWIMLVVHLEGTANDSNPTQPLCQPSHLRCLIGSREAIRAGGQHPVEFSPLTNSKVRTVLLHKSCWQPSNRQQQHGTEFHIVINLFSPLMIPSKKKKKKKRGLKPTPKIPRHACRFQVWSPLPNRNSWRLIAWQR